MEPQSKLPRFAELEKLQLVILPGKCVSERYLDIYQKGFRFWKKQWLPIYKRLDRNFNEISDAFTRQAENIFLFHNSEAVALFCMDTFNLRFSAHMEHSYFKAYPKDLVESLRLNNVHNFIVANQLAVSKEYRGGTLAELLIGLTIKRMQESSYNYILSYSRNSTKTNEMAYRWGCTPLLSNQQAHGESADFVLIDKGSLDKYRQHPLAEKIELLWKNRIHQNGFLNERIYNESTNVKDGLSTDVVSGGGTL